MTHQIATGSARLSSSIGSAPTYTFPAAATYPSSLLPPPTTSTAAHISHQALSTAASAYQPSSSHHQLPPTPNSLVTMMGSNSGNSNSTIDPLSELSISSVSPVQQHQHPHQHQQSTQGSSPPLWSSTITSNSRVNLSNSPTHLQQPHSYNAHPQAFASPYVPVQNFQQPSRPPHQSSFGWY